jgi:threonyl-tRNA synthetase
VKKVQEFLQNKGFRVISDLRNEKIGFKIREHTLQKIPYLIVVGNQEVENETIAVRTRSGDDLGVMSVDDFMRHLHQDITSKGITGS